MKTVWGILCLLVVFGGCDKSIPAPAEVTDPEQIAIRDLIDKVSSGIDKDEFKSLFAGDAPKKQSYFELDYYARFPQMDPEVSVNGDTATVKVNVSTVDSEGFSVTKSVNWTVKKVDGQWKIQDYPVE